MSTLSPAPAYPRGSPLTQSMDFTDRDGTAWLAYIEGAQPPPSPQPTGVTVLPGRHLRFDSATESRFTSLLPAGSPFLAQARLQSLLDGARPDLPLAATAGAPAPAHSTPESQSIAWSSRGFESDRSAITDWSRRWRRTASWGEALRRHVLGQLVRAGNTVHGWLRSSWAIGRLGHRSAAQPRFR